MMKQNLNRLTAGKETEFIIKNLLTKKRPRPDGFTDEFHPTFKEIIPILLKLSQENRRGRNSSKLNFMRFSTDLIPKPHKDALRKANYRPLFLMSIEVEILKKILANQILQYIKRIMYHNQGRFFLLRDARMVQPPQINVLYHSNKTKAKNRMIISIYADEVNQQNSTYIYDENSSTEWLVIEATYLHIKMATYGCLGGSVG